MGEKKKYSELVLEERKKGNVVFIAVDEFVSAPVKDIVAQPVDGLLWDLNREEETALVFMDREGMIHWVNNFAVALVIRELKSQLMDAEQMSTERGEKRDILYKENEALMRLLRQACRFIPTVYMDLLEDIEDALPAGKEKT